MNKKDDIELYKLEKEKERERLKKLVENKERRLIPLRIPAPLHKKFKALATEQGTNMTTILLAFIKKYVEKG